MDKFYDVIAGAWQFVIAGVCAIGVVIWMFYPHKPNEIEPLRKESDAVVRYARGHRPVVVEMAIAEVIHVEADISSKQYNDRVDVVGVKRPGSESIYVVPVMDLQGKTTGDIIELEITHILHDDQNSAEYIFARSFRRP